MAGFNLPQGMGAIRPQQQLVQGGPMPMNNMRPVGHMQVMNTSMPQSNMGDISNQMMRLWQLQQQQQRIGQRQGRMDNQIWQGNAQVDKSGGQVDDLNAKLMKMFGRQSPLDMTPDSQLSTPITRNNTPYEFDYHDMELPDEEGEPLGDEEDDDDLMYDYPRSYYDEVRR
jgi:hypothetical protein